MVKKLTELPTIEGDQLIASFLLDKKIITTKSNFIRSLIKLLSKRKIRLLGGYRRDKHKLKNLEIKKLQYFDIYNRNIILYFVYQIKKQKFLFYLDAYNYSSRYFRMDFMTSHFDFVERNDTTTRKRNILKFLRISKNIHLFTNPLYALIGQEEIVPALEDILEKKAGLPNFWGFYSKKIVDLFGFSNLKSVLKSSYIFEKLKDGSIFFAIEDWDKSILQTKKLINIKRRLLHLINKKGLKNRFKKY